MDLPSICHALGNETRYQIVKALHDRSIVSCCNRIEYHENAASVGDIVKLTGLAQSTVSQHLAVLEKTGLVRKEKRELWSCYFLNHALIEDFLARLGQELAPGSACDTSSSSCS